MSNMWANAFILEVCGYCLKFERKILLGWQQTNEYTIEIYSILFV